MRLRDHRGNALELGEELGRGGEGAVYAVPSRDATVAKVYHDPPDDLRARKLTALAALSTERLRRLAAWPSGSLHTADGDVAGFLMPRVQGYKNVHLLYGPKSRVREFPAASYAFLVRAAANLCRAFAVVHEHGHVVGDVNDKIAMVSPQATVMLVDCDSFQVRHDGALFTCDVGVPTHQPPELQHVTTFRGLERTAQHDAFGLAVIVFQMLFMARHPFSGAFVGPGEMTIDRAIRESRFVYGTGAAAAQMRPPPHSLPLSTVGTRVGDLFERAFARDASTSGRPAASEWVDALESLERSLHPCDENPLHTCLDPRRGCPLCAVESEARVPLFGQGAPRPAAKKAATTRQLAEVWAEVELVKVPAKAPPMPTVLAATTPSELAVSVAAQRESKTFLRTGLVLASMIAGMFGMVTDAPYVDAIALGVVVALWRATGVRVTAPWKEASRRLAVAEDRWTSLARQWELETTAEPFTRKRAELVALRASVEALTTEEEERVRQISLGTREGQLDRFLVAQRITTATIPGVSQSDVSLLQSRGVRNAKDVSARTVVPDHGLTLGVVQKIHDWRKHVEGEFRYDAAQPHDQVAIAAVRRDVEEKRERLLAAMADGPARLRALAQEIEDRRRAMEVQVRGAAELLARAKADVEGVR